MKPLARQKTTTTYSVTSAITDLEKCCPKRGSNLRNVTHIIFDLLHKSGSTNIKLLCSCFLPIRYY